MRDKKLVELFFDLVTIDSPSGYESEIRNFLITYFTKLGISTEVDNIGNLFARVNGVGDPIVLSAHMDTVEPGRGVKPRIVGGVIKSDGKTILGADNKAALASIVSAIEAAGTQNRSLEIVFSVKEETDGGINKFDFTRLKSKSGLCADSGFEIGTIVSNSPWITDLKIEIFGRSAHSAEPEKGRNALVVISEVVERLKPGRLDADTTLNFGIVEGGSATNTVPGNMTIGGEIRSFNYRSLRRHLNHLETLLAQAASKHGVKYKILTKPYCTGYNLNRNAKAVVETSHILGKLGHKPKFKNSFGGSDSNAFLDNGISVINIGDGCKNLHTQDEEIALRSLVDLRTIFVRFIKGM